jgi:hypothetical protein
MSGILARLWKFFSRPRPAESRGQLPPAKRHPEKRTHNLFEAAAAYVSACAEDDQDGIDEAATWVSPEALSFGAASCTAEFRIVRDRGPERRQRRNRAVTLGRFAPVQGDNRSSVRVRNP